MPNENANPRAHEQTEHLDRTPSGGPKDDPTTHNDPPPEPPPDGPDI